VRAVRDRGGECRNEQAVQAARAKVSRTPLNQRECGPERDRQSAHREPLRHPTVCTHALIIGASPSLGVSGRSCAENGPPIAGEPLPCIAF